MRKQQSRRFCRRYASIRAARLKPQGHEDWIPLSMIDWSAAGAGLSGATEQVELGPAVLQIPNRHGSEQIQLACEVIWRTEDKVGLLLRGPVSP